jgi:hypothetical protein
MRAPLWAATGIKVVAQMEDAMTCRINSQIEHVSRITFTQFRLARRLSKDPSFMGG